MNPLFTREPLAMPCARLPDSGMDPELAYQHVELMLDGNAGLNLVTFELAKPYACRSNRVDDAIMGSGADPLGCDAAARRRAVQRRRARRARCRDPNLGLRRRPRYCQW
jgi:hypothetical protein